MTAGWTAVNPDVDEVVLPAEEDAPAVAVVVVLVELAGVTAVVVVVCFGPGRPGMLESTRKFVPVVTVTWAPSVVGPYFKMTAPERESATSCAAAMSAGVRWA